MFKFKTETGLFHKIVNLYPAAVGLFLIFIKKQLHAIFAIQKTAVDRKKQ